MTPDDATGKIQAAAIAAAVRDALVDRTLAEHTAHLAQINGSQRETAAALASVDRKLDGLAAQSREQTAVQAALTASVREERGLTLSRRTIWIAVLGVIAAYCSMILLLVTSHP